MATSIKIVIEDRSFEAELDDSPAAKRLLETLPLELRLSRWGDEYYGNCGLTIPSDASARELMEVGEIAYWPAGSALCLFFGPTPASSDERPRAASPVLPLGRLKGDSQALKGFGSSVAVRLER